MSLATMTYVPTTEAAMILLVVALTMSHMFPQKLQLLEYFWRISYNYRPKTMIRNL